MTRRWYRLPPCRSPAPSPLLLRQLRKAYGDVVAVDGLDLEIRPGECFGLLGPNGAGKTTTIEICEGLTDAGRRRGPDPGPALGHATTASSASCSASRSRRPSSPRSSRWPRRSGCSAASIRGGPEAGEVIDLVQLRGEGGGPRRPAVRRPAAAAGPGLRAGRRPRAALSRRAHHRARPAVPPPALGADRALPRRRPLDPAHHPLYGRSRAALRPRGHRGPRAHHRRRARRAS